MAEVGENPRADHWQVTRELEPRLLSHFLAVADAGSISAAAVKMNLSQPALSKSIRHLEERLNVKLLNRFATGVELTPYGEALARRGRLIQREVSHAVTELHSMKGGTTGLVRIGAGLIWSAKYLPPILAKFLGARRGMKIEMCNGVIDTLIPQLTSGTLDLVCTTLDFPNSSDIVKESLVRVEHAIFARADHPLLAKSQVTPADLSPWGWVTLKDDYVGHNRLGAYFAANRLSPPIVRMEMAPDMSVISTIAQSDFLCTLPIEMEAIASAQRVVRLEADATQLWASNAGVAYRRTDYPAPATETLLALIREYFDAPLPQY